MTTKLNLTIQEPTARKAKLYAAENNVSVSKLVEDYLNKLTATVKIAKQKSFAEKYAGTVSVGIKDIKAAKETYLKKKYGL